ncbi:TWO-COMPONENT RESPONSE REGULATOR 24 [Salix koriyanagi]|uniref:TWO-COMPONENT RESPONSE REGULATOR 24 n=1 Tax=Salix koriyanagi TaxID=2511006 RepID=A0A9Q0PVZ0_9ROSI|nr:TWO-COMPONENT RESPONSE REGULATOR 24 [Salix koriyanagi]
MANKDNTQMDLESKMLFSELDHFIAKSQEKSDGGSTEIIAAKSFKIEIEASIIARSNLDQEVRSKIDKARQWLNQKMDGLKTEEDGQENKGPISSNSIVTRSSSPVSSGEALNFFQCLPCDPKAMAADHHMYCLRRCFEKLMNTLLVVSAEIERIKAGVSAGLEKTRESSFVSKVALSESDEFSPKTTDIDESNKEDNRNASDHPEEQGNEHDLPSKAQGGGDAEEDDRNASDHPEEQGNEQALPSKAQDGGDAEEDDRNASDHPEEQGNEHALPEEDNGNASDHPGEQGNEHDLPSKTPGGGYAEEDNGNASDHPGEQGNEHALPGKVQDGGDAEEDDRNKSDHPEEQGNEQDLPGYAEEDNGNASDDHPGEQGNEHDLPGKTPGGGYAEEDNGNASDHPGEQGNEHALPGKVQDGGDAEEDDRNKSDHPEEQGNEQDLPGKTQDGGDAEEDDRNASDHPEEQGNEHDLPSKAPGGGDAEETQLSQKSKQSRKIKRKPREIRSTLVHEPGDTSSNLEAGSREIASTVKRWLNQKALIGGDATGDQDQGDTYSVLIVDDDRNARDAIQRYTIRIGEQKHCTMEFQEAKNGKEAVYLHLAGASFDLIVMDDHMPIMTGIQATQLLRKMGVKSQIVGVTSEPDHQAFIDAGFNTCVRKPRSIA